MSTLVQKKFFLLDCTSSLQVRMLILSRKIGYLFWVSINSVKAGGHNIDQSDELFFAFSAMHHGTVLVITSDLILWAQSVSGWCWAVNKYTNRKQSFHKIEFYWVYINSYFITTPMEISKLLGLFSNDGLTCAERVEFSKWKVNRLKVEQLMPRKCISAVLWQNPIIQSNMHQIFTHMYSTVSIGQSFKENLTGFWHTPFPTSPLSNGVSSISP